MTGKFGLLVRMEAKAGQGGELGEFLQAARALAVSEQGSVSWYALKINDAALHGRGSERVIVGGRALFDCLTLIETDP